jgi:hypothetical protein
MSNEPKFTIDIVPVGDHLQATIPEFGLVVETGPGETKRDDAERVALAAISDYHMQQYERSRPIGVFLTKR